MMREKKPPSQKERVRAHIFVSGTVQGVFFRAYTSEVASSLGLTGWVRNLADGRVEILTEGPHKSMVEFIEWCEKGPPIARVEKVVVNWEEAVGDYDSFRIIH